MTQQALQALGGVLDKASLAALNSNFTDLYGAVFSVGNVFYADATNGSDTANDGKSAGKAFSTLAQAYNSCVSGHNDVVVIIGDGTTTATQRLTAGFTWSKNATHLLGICSPSLYFQRARIAPTSTATAFTPFFTISGNGCMFQNVSWYAGFTTGTTAAIAMLLTGSRNVFKNCSIMGMVDAASAGSATSRCLKIGLSGSGENLFESCQIGSDTVARTAANASVEFTADTVRNTFRDCVFPFMTSGSGSGALAMLTAGTGSMDRHQVFERCNFINAVSSTSSTMTALATFAASSGGLVLLKNCTAVGITDLFSDASTAGQMFIDGGAPTSNTSALAVNPT